MSHPTFSHYLTKVRTVLRGKTAIRDAAIRRPATRGYSARCYVSRLCGAFGACLALTVWCPVGRGQKNAETAAPAAASASAPASAEEVQQLRETVQSLLARMSDLESQLKQQQVLTASYMKKEEVASSAVPASVTAASAAATTASTTGSGGASNAAAAAPGAHAEPPKEQASAAEQGNLGFLHGATLNFLLDEYYEYNFNDPVGRVNALRAYDVLSNNISLNQADVVFEKAPDVENGNRIGMRLDLQFGQATDTLQGDPLNEPRPDIYRNIFQAYGTYVAPIGNGLTLDIGKFGSSIGFEGNYTKDQMNYSRAYWFNFLPFYHMGLRANYKVNDKLTLNYWLVNGTNQVEATNGYKDELFGFTATPNKKISWTVNYYLGQEHPDRVEVTSSGPVPVQPGLTFAAISPAPNGKLDIFDSYASWQATSKLMLALEGDYVIQRLWATQAPGESAAPAHTTGGAAYAKYQLSPKFAVGGRMEYMSDRGGMFSGITQALKETTATFDYKLTDGFLMRYEWRRDFSNRPSFFTDATGILSKEQQTATVGVIWWWGKKDGAW